MDTTKDDIIIAFHV